jgi:hypothetical protein
MIQYLSLFLADSARTWLNHLGEGTVNSWANLDWQYYIHFEGAYAKPGTTWEI